MSTHADSEGGDNGGSAPEPEAAPAAPAPPTIPEPGAVTIAPLAGEPGAAVSSSLPGEMASFRWPDLPPRPPRQNGAGRVIALVVLIVVGVAGVGLGGTLLTRELTRGPTKAEKAAAIQSEIASRWQRYSAGEIFPPTLGYTTADDNVNFNASRVGIAPAANCSAALDPAIASLLAKYGCVTVLRATYLDYSGTEAVTIGLVVMESTSAANQVTAYSNSLPSGAGVRTFPLPSTLAGQFGDAQRQFFSSLSSIGSYLFLSVAGYADGRVSASSSNVPPYLSDLGSGVIISLQSVMSSHPDACAMKDIRC
jgi:hypothetical protein